MAGILGEGKHAHADRSQGALRASNGHDQGRAKSLARSCCQRRQFRQGTRRRRALFIVHGLHDVDIQLRAGLGLIKGEAHHALKDPLRIGCRGEIRDRTSGARHFRIAGLNRFAPIIIRWKTEKLGHAVRERELAGLDTPLDLPVHVSPFGWTHIRFTGECRLRRTAPRNAWSANSHRAGIDPCLAAAMPLRRGKSRKDDLRPFRRRLIMNEKKSLLEIVDGC
ncbi:MAG: Tn3 family transposase [Boseongicola sp.]|nr:Tn3 family transposase [Boseongicola sp.]